MSICRVNKKARGGFTQLDNALINDINLSFRSLGVLTYLLSKPHNWQVRMAELGGKRTEGREAIRATVKELEAAGYMRREKQRSSESGKFSGWIYEVYEEPQSPTDGLPTDGKPTDGFSPPTNTEYKNTEFTKSRKKKEPIALEGLSDSSSKNLPATPGEPKAPPASTTVPAVRDYPKQPSGRADRLAILKAHYADPADRLAKLYRYFEWDQETARQFITRRENGSLPDKTINLLTRYFRKALDMSDSGWKRPGTMRDLLRDIPGTVRVCRIYVDQVDLHAAATDLASVSWGHHGTTHTVLTQAESWVADHPGHLPLDACGDSFIKWPLWAIRVCLAQQGQHFDIDPEEIPRLAEEVADDPLIPIMSFWGTLDPVKVLGLSMDEIRALNKTRVADRQARVDDLKSLL